MGVRSQQDVANFVGHDVAENITDVFLSTSSHVRYATDEYAYETSTRDGHSKRAQVRLGPTFHLGREQANVDDGLAVNDVSRLIDRRGLFESDDVPPGDRDADLAVNPGHDGLGFLDHRLRQSGEVLNDDRHVEGPVLRGNRHGSDCTGYRYRACRFPSSRHVRCLLEPRGLGRHLKEQEWRAKTVRLRKAQRKRSLAPSRAEGTGVESRRHPKSPAWATVASPYQPPRDRAAAGLGSRSAGSPRAVDPARAGGAPPPGALAHAQGTRRSYAAAHGPRQRGVLAAGGSAPRALAGPRALLRHVGAADAAHPRECRAVEGLSETRRRSDQGVVRRGARRVARTGRRPRGPRRCADGIRGRRCPQGTGRRVAVLWRPERGGKRGGAEGLAGNRAARLEAGEGLAASRADERRGHA